VHGERLHRLADRGARATNSQLREEELELGVVGAGEGGLDLGRELPEVLLEWA
jgi:hypothetical protein